MTCPTCGHTEESTKTYVLTKYLEQLEEKAKKYDLHVITKGGKLDKLDAIFRMQKEFADQIEGKGRFPYLMSDQIKELCTAIIHEAIELQDLTNWKWWKQPIQFNQAAAKEELIDIFHFVIHAAISLNMWSDDFLDAYNKKMEINKQRQEQGY